MRSSYDVDIKNSIEKIRKVLDKELGKEDGSINIGEILEISRNLDELLIRYMKLNK